MHTIDAFPGIGFIHLGPTIDDTTAELRAWQLSHFMREEVHGPVYEQEFGLRLIDQDPPSGTPGDIPWRIASMRQNNRVQADGSYPEYIIAIGLDGNGEPSSERLAIAGLLVATKPQGRCTVTAHTPTHIAEIDVARRMYGKKLAAHLLAMLRETHPADPYIDLEVYEGNLRSLKFHRKLGCEIVPDIPPINGTVYAGRWVTMRTTGQQFAANLQTLL